MECLIIDIIEYTQNNFPGYVHCKLIDAFGRTHFFEEKIPIVSVENINRKTILPKRGIICGEIINKEDGIICFSTLKPDDIKSIDGENIFYVNKEQIVIKE
jgi:hypothetical protein